MPICFGGYKGIARRYGNSPLGAGRLPCFRLQGIFRGHEKYVSHRRFTGHRGICKDHIGTSPLRRLYLVRQKLPRGFPQAHGLHGQGSDG